VVRFRGHVRPHLREQRRDLGDELALLRADLVALAGRQGIEFVEEQRIQVVMLGRQFHQRTCEGAKGILRDG
jgi:hypothetical protein